MKRVSIILTTYNSEELIQEVLDSINFQNGNKEFFEIELLVVDDCSTDTTQEILSKNNIDFLTTNQNSGGPNKGRNLALKKCTGDYICIADHDDVWFPNKIEKLLAVSELAPIVTSGYILFDISNSKKTSRVNKSLSQDGYIIYQKNETFLSKLVKSKKGQQIYLGSILFHSSLKHILFEEKYGMIDFDWVLRIFNNQVSVEVCEPLYMRKVKNTNLSLNENYRINDYNYSLNTIFEYESLYPDHVAVSRKKINGSMARYYYLMGNMKLARQYFLKSSIDLKTLLYILTSFFGSKIVKRYFKIFG